MGQGCSHHYRSSCVGLKGFQDKNRCDWSVLTQIQSCSDTNWQAPELAMGLALVFISLASGCLLASVSCRTPYQNVPRHNWVTTQIYKYQGVWGIKFQSAWFCFIAEEKAEQKKHSKHRFFLFQSCNDMLSPQLFAWYLLSYTFKISECSPTVTCLKGVTGKQVLLRTTLSKKDQHVMRDLTDSEMVLPWHIGGVAKIPHDLLSNS